MGVTVVDRPLGVIMAAMTERGEQKRKRTAAVALAKARAAQQAYRQRKLGKLGPAGPCKRIDPKTGEVIEVIAAKGK